VEHRNAACGVQVDDYGTQLMKTRTLTILIEQDEDGYYVATVPALRSCYTQARTLPALRKRVLEVIKLCLARERPPQQEFIAVERIEIPA